MTGRGRSGGRRIRQKWTNHGNPRKAISGATVIFNEIWQRLLPETDPLLPLAYHDAKSKTPAAKSIPVLVRPQ
jgi:hypothetical protein